MGSSRSLGRLRRLWLGWTRVLCPGVNNFVSRHPGGGGLLLWWWFRAAGTRFAEAVELERRAALELHAVDDPDHAVGGPFDGRRLDDPHAFAAIDDHRDLVAGSGSTPDGRPSWAPLAAARSIPSAALTAACRPCPRSAAALGGADHFGPPVHPRWGVPPPATILGGPAPRSSGWPKAWRTTWTGGR